MSVEPFVEPFTIKVNQGVRENVGAYMVVVLLHILPHLLIWNSKKSFSVEEAKVEEKAEGTPLERARAGDRTRGAPMGTS